jgi:TetR/AcrR family transcriptional regulator, transcriptional repressor of aconitase
MPRITEERREARREQVLEAARACLQDHGLEAVSMEMIIARSGLSTGAVYGYFKGKDELINAVVTDGTAAMGRRLLPILTDPEPPPLPEFMARLLGTITEFGQGDGIDRLLASLHGWSHSQSNPELKALARAAYRRQRELFADVARRWQAAGTLDPGADPDAMAELLQSVTLGFVAQRALAGDADVQAHVDALEALVGGQKTALRAGRPARGRGGLAGGEPRLVRDKKDLEFGRTGSGASSGSARLLGDDLLAQRQAIRADRRGSPRVMWRLAGVQRDQAGELIAVLAAEAAPRARVLPRHGAQLTLRGAGGLAGTANAAGQGDARIADVRAGACYQLADLVLR